MHCAGWFLFVFRCQWIFIDGKVKQKRKIEKVKEEKQHEINAEIKCAGTELSGVNLFSQTDQGPWKTLNFHLALQHPVSDWFYSLSIFPCWTTTTTKSPSVKLCVESWNIHMCDEHAQCEREKYFKAIRMFCWYDSYKTKPINKKIHPSAIETSVKRIKELLLFYT